MNDEQIIEKIQELEDELTVARLLAIRRLKKVDRAACWDVLSDAIKAIENIRDCLE
jgi:uncharacterized protein YerC